VVEDAEYEQTGGLMSDEGTRLVRHPSDGDVERWDDDTRGLVMFRTKFSADTTPTRRLTTGVGELPVGGRLALHRHEPEETYYVLEGAGTVTLDGAEYAVSAGSSVFIPSQLEHGMTNTGRSALSFFYVFAADAISDIPYRFSGAPGS
jgi:quercetin dioxygenase-like cupin family protein